MVHYKNLIAISPAWNQARTTIAATLHDAGYGQWCVTIGPKADAPNGDEEWTMDIDRKNHIVEFQVPTRALERMGFEEISQRVLAQLAAAATVAGP